ncbi:hypothetical protein NLU13_3742 [Sarocladium strictum]|uniref:Uncharacterized protein n=1 Tax=Sarocladium strictum TaxID=5046 RepID=A0AA39LAQ0_SARSR|nr:hypothetical protein NLU13_3742 [Sarocladium strictum]
MIPGCPGPASAGASIPEVHAVSHSDKLLHAARPGLNGVGMKITDSQDSTMSNSTDQVHKSPVSADEARHPDTETDRRPTPPSRTPSNQLEQLSTVASDQDRISNSSATTFEGLGVYNGGNAGGASKRTADGEVKQARGSMSPVKGHSRNTSTMSAVSTVSMASTTASTIGDLSSDLKTRLSYAMLKVQNGWQSNSLDEVESMASQAASPTSSNSTINRFSDIASPRIPLPSGAVQYGGDEVRHRPQSLSPPAQVVSKPGLAPPASIRPSAGTHPNKRRHSNARPPPKLHTTGHNASPNLPSQASPLVTAHLRPQDRAMYSPHQNVREQDAIETLLFMSSPGNSANMKHSFSPTGSPGPSLPASGSAAQRHALPSGPRKAQPSQRPSQSDKKIGFMNSPLTSQSQSPIDVDSSHASLNHPGNVSRRRVNGASSHLRGALSLPSGLGTNSSSSPRRTIDDAYVENMLERAAAESSDEEEIQLPPRRPAETFA